MNTAMQELINWLVPEPDEAPRTMKDIYNKARELEKGLEKSQIVNAFDKGMSAAFSLEDGFPTQINAGFKYYKHAFKEN